MARGAAGVYPAPAAGADMAGAGALRGGPALAVDGTGSVGLAEDVIQEDSPVKYPPDDGADGTGVVDVWGTDGGTPGAVTAVFADASGWEFMRSLSCRNANNKSSTTVKASLRTSAAPSNNEGVTAGNTLPAKMLGSKNSLEVSTDCKAANRHGVKGSFRALT